MRSAAERFRRFLNGPPKISQEEFAERIGASQASVSAWAGGRKQPGRFFALALETMTGIQAAAWPKVKPAPRGKAA